MLLATSLMVTYEKVVMVKSLSARVVGMPKTLHAMRSVVFEV